MAEARTPKTTKEAKDQAVENANTFEKMLMETIENKPYAAVAIALGLGWLFGRMHHPF
jgi:ElaB/YqjD/DUF883 family membrane-anchored ribosome-binding protein